MSDMSDTYPKRVRHNVKKDPVIQAVQWCAMFFVACEVVLVFLNFFMPWGWTIYSAWIFLGLVFVCCGVVLFLEKQTERVNKYHREMRMYQSNSSLMILDQPSHSPVTDGGVVWKEDGKPELDPLTDAHWESDDDVRTTVDQELVETERTSTDSPTEIVPYQEAPVDGNTPGGGWSTRGREHPLGHGFDRVSDTGTGTRIDLHAREALSGESTRIIEKPSVRPDHDE